jgi:hypothetical protein
MVVVRDSVVFSHLGADPKQGSPLAPVVRPGGTPSPNNKQAAQSAHVTPRTPLVSSGHALCAVRSISHNTLIINTARAHARLMHSCCMAGAR